MNYEKMSRAMRYHYGSERQGRKGHLAMVKEKRLFYRYIILTIFSRIVVFACSTIKCIKVRQCKQANSANC